MKKLLSSLIVGSLISISLPALADTAVIATDADGAPITVTNDSYVVTHEMAKPKYYYYSGHRCYAEKRSEAVGVNFFTLHAGVGGGTDIYCYPYP